MAEIEKIPSHQKKKSAPTYLYLIGNIYYFRYRLPKPYDLCLERKEIRINLGTAYLSQARKRAFHCYAQVQNYLEGLEMPRAKNKNIPQLSLNESEQEQKVKLEFDLPPSLRKSSLHVSEIPPTNALMGSDKKIMKFFENLEASSSFPLQSKEDLLQKNKKEIYASFPDCFSFDSENKEEISLDTIEKRMQGLLRYLLNEDSKNLKPRPLRHTLQEFFAGQVIVDTDEDISHIEYLRRYENIYKQLINNQDVLIASMEFFEHFLQQYPAVHEFEITRENVLHVINEYCKVMVSYFQILQARADFDYSKEKTVCSNDFIPYPPIIETASKPIILQKSKSQTTSKTTQADNSEIENGMMTSEFIALYAKYKVSDGKWRNETASGVHLQRLQYLIDILGDFPINKINHTYRREFFESLKKIPKSHRSAKYRNFSMQELLALEDKENLSAKSINIILQAISSMFTWGMAEGLLEVNPFRALSVPDNRNEKDLRLAFTSEDLQKIFSSADIQNAKNSSKPSRYWAPYIALHTGMRLNEIVQLYLEDIKIYSEEGTDYWYFDVTTQNAADKTLKAKYSERVVPIHNRLIELGFLDFVEKQRKSKQVRLFPEITVTASKGRYGHAISRFFSDLVKREGIEGKKTFHSLRHNFVEFFEKNDLMTNAFRQVLGHVSEDLASKQYGSKFSVKECYERVISKIDFGL